MSLHIFADFFTSKQFRGFLHIVSKIFSVLEKSTTYRYVQEKLFSGLKLTNLGELFKHERQVFGVSFPSPEAEGKKLAF